MTQGSYLKIQFWICMFFIADFVLEFSYQNVNYIICKPTLFS